MTQRAIDGDCIYFVTTNVSHGRWFFDEPTRAPKIGQAIQTCCQMKHFDLLAYCILPNHVHLLVRKLRVDETSGSSSLPRPHRTRGRVLCGGGEIELADIPGEANDIFLFPHRRRPRLRCPRSRPSPERFSLSQLMHSIKSTFAHSLSQGRFWHRRFHFRIIETEEYFANVIEYIRFNYRKMNLPERYGQPPFVFMDEGAIRQTCTNHSEA